MTDTIVVLASGDSSRMWPLARHKHKTLYPVGMENSLFSYTLNALDQNGWTRFVITAKPRDIPAMGKEVPPGADAVFVEQDEAMGQGDALLRAVAHITGSAFYVISPDKIFAPLLLQKLAAHGEAASDDIQLATTPTETPQLYGVVRTTQDGRVQEVVEKPAVWYDPAPQRITGVYRLSQRFLECLAGVPQHHYSLETALNVYAQTQTVRAVPAEDIPDSTLKHPWHLLEVNRLLMQHLLRYVSTGSHIEDDARIFGAAHIENGVRIAATAVVRGPCIIRAGAAIGDFALVRDHAYIGKGVLVGAHSEVKNSIVLDGTKMHNTIVLDSVIGENCNLGAGTRISNSRFDHEDITSIIKGEKVSTGLRHFGIVMGSGSQTATLANFMPGVKIGEGCRIGGSFDVTEDIPDRHSAYLKHERDGISSSRLYLRIKPIR